MAQPKNINSAILGVLESIDEKLNQQAQSTQKLNTNLEGMAATGVVSEEEYKTFSKFFGEIGKGITVLVKAMDKVSDKTGERFGTFVGKIGETIEKFFENTDEKQVTAFTALMEVLGKNVLSFALQMVLAIPLLIIAPIGAMLFGLTIRALLWAMGSANNAKKESAEGIASILGMGRGILLFALAMILFVPLSPIVAIGAIMFGLVIRLLLWVMGASGKGAKDTAKGISSILDLAKGILLFALSMIVVVLLFPVLLLGALIFALTLVILNLGLRLVSSKKARRGVLSLLILGLTIFAFALIIAFLDKIVTWPALLKTAAVIGGLALITFLIGKMARTIGKGAMVMIEIAISLLIVTVALLIFKAANITWKDVGILAAVIGVMALVGTVLGIPPIIGFVSAGAGALVVLGIALITFSIGLAIYANAAAGKITMTDVAVFGALIGVLALVGTLIGIPPIIAFVLAGAAGLIAIGVALVMISGSLAVFKAIKWNKKDGSALKDALGSVVSAFLGGEMPGGIFAAIKFAAALAARTALLVVAAVGFIPAGIALTFISAALFVFKKTGFNKKDAGNLEFAIASIVKAFGLVTDYARQKKMGFYVNPYNLQMGIFALAKAGSTLATLAKGIQAFANLTVTEYEVVGQGTKDAKIVPKRKVKLTKADFDLAAYGMSRVISAIASPFAEVGKLEMGASSENSYLSSIFGGKRYVSRGVSALRYSGDTLANLARGIQRWANLQLVEYEVVGQGTPEAKIVPKGIVQLSTGEIMKATMHASWVISNIAEVFADVGKLEHGDSSENSWLSSIFGGKKWVSKGVTATAKIGGILVQMGTAIRRWSNMQMVEFEVVGAGTPDAKIVPKGIERLTQGQMLMASFNASMIVSRLANVFADVGKLEHGSSSENSWLSRIFGGKKWVSKGVKAVTNIGTILTQLAKGIRDFARMQFVEYEVVNAGTSRAKLVPKGMVKVTGAMMRQAARNAGDVIMSLAGVMADIGSGQGVPGWKYITQKSLNAGVAFVAKLADPISKIADTMKKLAGMEVVTYTVKRGKLVPKSVVKLTPMHLAMAKMNLNMFIGIMASMMANVGVKLAPHEQKLKDGARIISLMSDNLMELSKPAEKWGHFKGINKTVSNFSKYMNMMKKYFDPEQAKSIGSMASNVRRFGIYSTWISDAAPGIAKYAGSQKTLTAEINNLDMDRLTTLNSLMCALATLGNSNVGLDQLGSELGAGMTEGFELLAEYLKEILEEMGMGGGGDAAAGGDGVPSDYPFPVPGSSPAKSKAAAPPAGSGGGGGDAQALIRALQSVTLKVKPGAGSEGKF